MIYNSCIVLRMSNASQLLHIDEVSAVVVALVLFVTVLVKRFSDRYLSDEDYRTRFVGLLGAASLGALLTALAGTPAVFAFGWCLTGISLLGLLALDRRARGSALAWRSAALSEGISGVSVAAIAVIALTSDFDGFGAAEWTSNAAKNAIAALVLIAALARCAQLPIGAWLTRSVIAPTPLSALMHAGIVNAGALLVIRWEGVVFSGWVVPLTLFVAAATTMLVTTFAMMARADVKGSLALSTRAQMGFMLLQCAVGAFAGAIFHMVAHGMYKAALFLGAGQSIDNFRRASAAAPQRPEGRRGNGLRDGVVAAVIPFLMLAISVALITPSLLDEPAKLTLFAFAWSTSAQALWWWMRVRRPSPLGMAGAIAALGCATVAYVAGFGIFKDFVSPALPDVTNPVSGWLVVPVFLALVSFTLARWAAECGDGFSFVPGAFARTAYARALGLGHINNRPRALAYRCGSTRRSPDEQFSVRFRAT